MRIDILTLFPNSFAPLKESIIERATSIGKIELNIINIRDHAKNKHKNCDDYTFGGGPGMLMMPQPIYDAITAIDGYEKAHKIYMSPKGRVFSQGLSRQYAKNYDHLIILCGHYEGVDQRIIDLLIDEEISIGDYVLSGGELGAAVLTDSIVRLIPGVLSDETSALSDSFQSGLVSPPVYTRPREYKGWEVPEVLLSGNDMIINEWKLKQAIERTKERRPEMYENLKKNN
jgi:tRNA (guanine37-N1)-methyltransferase